MSAAATDSVSAIICSCSGIGLLWAYYNFTIVSAVDIKATQYDDITNRGKISAETRGLNSSAITQQHIIDLKDVHKAIQDGANEFLSAEYRYCFYFCTVFAGVIFALISWGQDSTAGFLTALAFALGAITSMASGYIGMKIAIYSNVRTAFSATTYIDSFNTAFRAGSVMGFALTSLGIGVLYTTLSFYSGFYSIDNWPLMMDAISGFGLGGSTIALFGRVGGGIYTKAADVGADLSGKVINDLPEDDPRNPAVIADNVGDNVGDIAGMGADLFGSYAEATCACLVIASQNVSLRSAGWNAICFPLVVSSLGVIVCLLTSFVATHIYPVIDKNRIEIALRLQLIISTVMMIPATSYASSVLPATFNITGIAVSHEVTSTDAVICVCLGAVGGLIIGLTTEYYTSKEYSPVRDLVKACKNGGAATNVIYGLALGYKSCVVPVFILASIIYVSFELCDLYGVSLAAIGMLSNLATGLTIDAYGPVCDNAGGIAEMANLPKEYREKTDELDAAGNTTAAVGKGFAIGSAALVSLALFGAFVTRVKESGITADVQILQPLTFAFLLIGSMLPYWFSAMTMKSVGKAAEEMVVEVKRQFDANPRLITDPKARPDYKKCVSISTKAALQEMIAPGALVILAPLLAGSLCGVYAVYGLLTGGLLSGVQLAISMSNTGGAWDNCKKYISATEGKGNDAHKAAVIGDTIGDPLKDTSGPALNILMKLMAILSLVFADYFASLNNGQGLLNLPI